MNRPMIVVSNRGPVTYDRDETGARIERRGGGGLVSALRGLADRADVTWIASATTDEDRDRRERRRRRPERRSPGARPRRVRAVLQRDREPAALVRPAFAVGSRDAPRHRPVGARGLGQRLRPLSTVRSRTLLLPNWTTVPAPPSSFTTTTCISPRASCARRARTHCSPSSCTSPGRPTGVFCRAVGGRRCATACWRMTWSRSTRSAGRTTSSRAATPARPASRITRSRSTSASSRA